MTKRNINAPLNDVLIKEMEKIRDETGVPVSRQIKMKLNGYSIIKEDDKKDNKTAIQLSKRTVECLKKIVKKGETYDDIIKRMICDIYPEFKSELYNGD